MKKCILAAATMACMGMAVTAQAAEEHQDSRLEILKPYLSDIGASASQHRYNQVVLSWLDEDVDHYNGRGHSSKGFELRVTKTLGNHLYGIGQLASIDDDGMESQRISLGLGLRADIGVKATATDIYSEMWLTHYDVTQEADGFTNEDDGVMVDWRLGLRSNWGIQNVDSRLYVGMTNAKGYSGDEDQRVEGVLGASIGYSVVPQVTASVSIERLSGGEFSVNDPEGISYEGTVTTRLSLAYNF